MPRFVGLLAGTFVGFFGPVGVLIVGEWLTERLPYDEAVGLASFAGFFLMLYLAFASGQAITSELAARRPKASQPPGTAVGQLVRFTMNATIWLSLGLLIVGLDRWGSGLVDRWLGDPKGPGHIFLTFLVSAGPFITVVLVRISTDEWLKKRLWAIEAWEQYGDRLAPTQLAEAVRLGPAEGSRLIGGILQVERDAAQAVAKPEDVFRWRETA